MNEFRAIRIRIFDGRETASCFWCHDPLTVDDSTIDHVVSRAEGGGHQYQGKNNIVLSCGKCNGLRGTVQGGFYGLKRSLKDLQRYSEVWPMTRRKRIALNIYLGYREHRKSKMKSAEKEFQERCKIELRKGPAGMIYPVDPVPELPETKETDESPEKKELDEQFSPRKDKAVQWS